MYEVFRLPHARRVMFFKKRKKRIAKEDHFAPKENSLEQNAVVVEASPVLDDEKKRLFLKFLGVAGLGLVGTLLFPKKADAYVFGSTPASNTVGLKNNANTAINPATDESVQALAVGQGVTKTTISVSNSGTALTPTLGTKIRVYSIRFSLTADLTSVSFRFTAGGTDFEKYLTPKSGGLYGSNNHPNYVEGGVDEVLYVAIAGTGTVQINIDYKLA